MRIAGYQVGDRWWNRCALAGLYGGIAMAIYEMIVAATSGRGLWWPLNMVGGAVPYFRPIPPGFSDHSLVLPHPGGPLVLAQPGMLWPGTTIGAALHLMTSMFFGLAYGLLVAVLAAYFVSGLARSWTFAVMAGLGWGVATWIVMGLIVGPYLSPSLVYATPGQYFTGHLIYGLVTALSFTALVRRPRVLITLAPQTRTAERTTARR